MKILGLLFIVFGMCGIIIPGAYRDNYTVYDILRAWGIYSVTIGALLIYPRNICEILICCFIVSIIWHYIIVYNNPNKPRWTTHHVSAIIANLFAIVLVIIYKYKPNWHKIIK